MKAFARQTPVRHVAVLAAALAVSAGVLLSAQGSPLGATPAHAETSVTATAEATRTVESFSWTDSGLISDAAGDLVAQTHRYSIYLEDGTMPVLSGLKVYLSKVDSLDPDHPTLAQLADVFGTDEASILSKLNVGKNTLKVRLDGSPESKVLATAFVTVKEDTPVIPTPDPDPGTPTDPGENPTDPGTPTDPDTPTDPGDTPTDPGQTPTDPNTPTDPGQNPSTPDKPDDHPGNGGEQPTDQNGGGQATPDGGSQTPAAPHADDGTFQPPVAQPGVDGQDTAGQAKLAQTGGDDSGLWIGVGAASLLIAGGGLAQLARRKRS